MTRRAPLQSKRRERGDDARDNGELIAPSYLDSLSRCASKRESPNTPSDASSQPLPLETSGSLSIGQRGEGAVRALHFNLCKFFLGGVVDLPGDARKTGFYCARRYDLASVGVQIRRRIGTDLRSPSLGRP